MKKTIYLSSPFLLLFLFFGLHIKGQPTTKNYPSLLWEVIHPSNPQKVSYLYGTMHVSKKLAFNLSDTFFIGLRNADIIALESEPTDWMEEVMDLKYATEYFGAYPTYKYIQKGFYQRIFPLSAPQNDEVGGLISSRDLMINSLQYRNNPYMLDFEEDTYLDMFIHMSAKKTGRRVVGLENIAHTNDLHRLARSERRSPKDDKPIPLWLEEKMKDQDLGSIFENAYRQQDLDLMMELLGLFQSDHYSRWFLEERNRLMADSMVVLMQTKSVFAGVGAAHLAGDKGMVTFLRQNGCKVRPVVFMKTDLATQEKSMLDSLKTPLQLILQTAPDAQFSMLLPAKLYELPYSGKHYLCSEMTNGSFVSIIKQNTFNLLSGLTPEHYLDKVDSLLFENIPGTILSKRSIENGPYKGIEIKNKTKTGNHQHYQIFSTPFELIIFKMGGTGDFILDWSDSVFNSLRFAPHPPRKSEWTKVSHVFGGFSVQVPEVHVFDVNTPVTSVYNQPMIQAFDPKTGNQFLLTRNVLMDYFYLEEDNFELERTAEKLAKKHKMELVNQKLVTYQGLPALEFALKNKKNKLVHFKMIISGGHYYLLAAKIEKEKGQLAQFFNSFEITSFQYQKPFAQFTDTFLYFNTLTSKDINESNIRLGSSPEKPKDYEEQTEAYVYLAETGESVRVYFRKYHQYEYYPSIDSIFKEDIADITRDNSQFVISKSQSETDELHILDALLGDTGSLRAIKLRIVVKKTGDTKYTLRSLVDTVHQSSPFLDAFYTNFSPFDTVMQASVFDKKGDLFLDDIVSQDTANFKRAMSSLHYVYLDSTNTDRVLSLLEKYDFEKQERGFLRHLLLRELSVVKDNKLIPFAKELYLDNNTNYPMQIAALAIICAQVNEEAIDTLKSIMLQELPFVMDDDTYILSPIRYQKMELWKKMYPLLFQFDNITEYKNIIYRDLSNLLDSNVIDASFYESFVPKLLIDAEFVLKKHMANEQKKELEKAKSQAVEQTKSTAGLGNPNDNLVQKYQLLLPHLSNPEVSALVANYDSYIQSEANKIAMMQVRNQQKLPFEKDPIIAIAQKPNMLLDVYKALKDVNALDVLPTSLLNDQMLAKLTINAGKSTYYYGSNKFDFEKDTFVLRKQEPALMKGKTYKVYTYEVKQFISKTDAEKSSFTPKDFRKLALIAVQLEQGKVDPTLDNYNTTVRIENPERVEKYMEEMLEEFLVKDRKRASAKEVSDSMYDYWDF